MKSNVLLKRGLGLACGLFLVGCGPASTEGEGSLEGVLGGSIVGLVDGDEAVVTADDEMVVPTASDPDPDPRAARLQAMRQRIEEARKLSRSRFVPRQQSQALACDEVVAPSCVDRVIILDSTTDMAFSESLVGKGDDIDPTKNIVRMKTELLARLPDYTHISEEFDRRVREGWTRTFDRRIEQVTGAEDLILVFKACEKGIYSVRAKGNNVPVKYHWRPRTLDGICGSEVERVSGTMGGGANQSSHGFGLEKGQMAIFVFESDARKSEASIDLEITYERAEW